MTTTTSTTTTTTTSSAGSSLAAAAVIDSQRRIQFFRPAYLEAAGVPSMPWANWLRLYDYFIVGSGLNNSVDGLRLAVLFGSLGTEAARVASDLTDATTPYDETIRRLTERFGERQSLIFARTNFHRRVQETGEDILSYVTELRRLASYCKFGAVEHENVRDRLVAGCLDEKIRDRLILEPETLSLDNATVLAQNIERATSESKRLGTHNASSSSRDSSLLKLSSTSPRRHEGRDQSRTRLNSSTCGNCGYGPHSSSNPCPARSQQCRSCGKTGHFARVCRSRPPGRQTNRPRHEATDQTDRTVTVVQIATVTGDRPVNSYVDLDIAGVQTRLLIDTGAQASVLNVETLRKLSPRVSLRVPPNRLKNFGGYSIPLRGAIVVPVQYEDLPLADAQFYIVERGECVLGQDLFDRLGFSIVDGAARRIRTVKERAPTAVNNPLHNEVAKSTAAAPAVSVPHPLLESHSSILQADPRKSIRGFTHTPVVNTLVPPVAQPLRRVPLALLPKVKAEIERMVNDGVLQQIEAADWVSNMVVVHKANGAIRICVDLTAVNKAVIPDRFPLPTIEELSEFFAGATVFSKIDLKWGYLQVKLDESAHHLTSMITPFGLYKWVRLPFGLCSAPSCFQKIVASILDGIQGVRNLLDDIIISASTKAEHDKRLREVLDRLVQHDVVINVEKSTFCAEAVDFVGHHVSSHGVSPLDSNIAAISDLKAPSTHKELRSVLGAAGFYRKFVPRFSEIVEPLNNLLKNDAEFVWGEEQQQAFEQLKAELVSTRVLAHFDAKLPTVVTTDASGVAIGAVLSQLQTDGVERPVAYASRTLSSAERAYSVSEREALACIWACERWNYYLYGRHFTLRTDHSALTTLLSGGQKGRRPMRLLRWSDRLNAYNFDVEYKPGLENVVADLLSRNSSATPETTVGEEPLAVLTIFGGTPLDALKISDVADATAADDELSAVARKCTTGWLEVDVKTPWLAPYAKLSHELTVDSGVVFRGDTAVIPFSLRQRVLQLAHEGHPGIVKMRQRTHDTVWWPNINADVEAHVKNCAPCLVTDKSARPVVTPLQPLPLPPKPWHTIAVDIKGELHGEASRWRYLIVVWDLYSKWPEVRAVNTVTSSAVITFLKELFARWGLPERVISDNGKQFVSREIEQFFKSLGISHSKTALYHPQSNGAVERFNRYLTDQLRIARVEGRPVDEALFTALSAYRSTRQCTTQRSPAELMCGRKMTMPLDRLLKMISPRKVTFDVDLCDNVYRAQQRYVRNYNRKAGSTQFIARNGDRFHVRRNVRNNKYEPMWTLPRRVTDNLGSATVRLDDGTVRNSRDLVAARQAVVPSAPPADLAAAPQVATPEAVAAAVPACVAAPPQPPPHPPERRYPARSHKAPARFDDCDFCRH